MTVKPVISLGSTCRSKDIGNGRTFKARVGSFAHRHRLEGGSARCCMSSSRARRRFRSTRTIEIHELFVILEGEGTYRFGDARYPVKAGDVCAAPTGGPEVAHQLINTGTTPLKYLGISNIAATEVVEYPDSKKFAVMSRFDWANPGGGGLRFVGRAETSLELLRR